MSAPLIVVQFSVGSIKRVPEWIQQRADETPEGSSGRNARNSANQGMNIVSEPVEKVDVRGLYLDLQLADYIPVSVWREDRIAKSGRRYHAIRFTFVHESNVREDGVDVSQQYPEFSESLNALLSDSLWRTRTFKNYRDDESLVSINLEVPVPIEMVNLRDSEGEVVLDEAGNRIKVETPANGLLEFDIVDYVASVAVA